ncbi:hypothetical protein BSKO_10311 [Bryopsis sp. KO-2023]|nr:hypothetical protein BSKO_10311 [Bryopsis sp. KO-2023]
MVLYFHPRGFVPNTENWLIYMGRDKFENEDLIKFGLPIDVWFHVDDLSSAHVYLRLPPGSTMDDIPPDTLEDCCQLVKANSIQGNKKASVDIVYTPWSNLNKSHDMDVGAVGFHDMSLVKKVKVPKKVNDIVNRLNRTKREEAPDLAAEKQAYDAEIRSERKAAIIQQRREEKAVKETLEKEKEARSYHHIMQEENMVSSKSLGEKYESVEDYEDDFM